jgi:hypothetical protein
MSRPFILYRQNSTILDNNNNKMDVLSSTTWPEGLELHHVNTPKALERWTFSLATLLHSCVNDDPPSSALGIQAPLHINKSEEFWHSLSPNLSSTTKLFVRLRNY